MSNTFDFNKYDDILISQKYDGFIDPNGYYYKVNLRNSGKVIDHNLWANEYMKNNGDKYRKLNFSASGLFTLSQISSVAEALVHIYGFIYYSHDSYTRKPIIILPNPLYNNCKMTAAQNEVLFNIMLLNNEDPFTCPIFTEDGVYFYSGNKEFRR